LTPDFVMLNFVSASIRATIGGTRAKREWILTFGGMAKKHMRKKHGRQRQ
jgi:hypothetical protein